MRNMMLEEVSMSSGGVPTAWSGGVTSVVLLSEVSSLLRSLLSEEGGGRGGVAGSVTSSASLRTGSSRARADNVRSVLVKYIHALSRRCSEKSSTTTSTDTNSTTAATAGTLSLEELVAGSGALVVLGSEGGPLRVGANVEVTTGPTTTRRGIVTRHHDGEGTVGVLFVDGQGEEESCPSVAVEVLDLVAPPSESEFEMDRELAENLVSIVRSGRGLVHEVESVMPWRRRRNEGMLSGEEEDIVLAARSVGAAVSTPKSSSSSSSFTAAATAAAAAAAAPVQRSCVGHSEWIVSSMRTRALSVLWCGMKNEQGSILSTVGGKDSIETLHRVAENVMAQNDAPDGMASYRSTSSSSTS